MKKFLLPCIMCMLFVSNLSADPMFFLLNQKKVNVEFNYEHARVDNIDSTDFADLRQAVSCEWERLFLNELNDELDDFEIKFGDHTEAVYTMLCNIQYVSVNGTIIMDIRFINTETLEECRKLKIQGRGGVFGSFANLIGDGMSRCGENLGEYIEDKIEL